MQRNFTVTTCLLAAVAAANGANPEDEFAGTVKGFFGVDFVDDWAALEKLPGVKWAPLPLTMLQNCLPDGGCFTLQGAAAMGGRTLTVMATGARTIPVNIYFRNTSAPFGESAVVAALKRAALSSELVRCPIEAGSGGTNWYRVRGANTRPGYLSIQSSCNGRPCEGFVLISGQDLPPLQPNQLRLYTEQCSATGAARAPVSTVMPHEILASALAALLPSSVGPVLYDWKALASLPAGIQWNPAYSGGANKNAGMQSGQLTVVGRTFSILASGSATQVKIIQVDEIGRMHPRGEDLLGALRGQGFTVTLVRCGPVYTESTNNWYSVTSAKTRPVMLKQSIRFEGNLAQDAYELRLDAGLPARDPRDRDPGVSGCR